MHKLLLVVDWAEAKAGLTTASLAGGSSHPRWAWEVELSSQALLCFPCLENGILEVITLQWKM